jgi:hypothetical protein
MHKSLRNSLPTLVAMTVVNVGAGQSASLLDRLAEELKTMRLLPVGAPTHSACPKHTGTLVGLRQAQVRNTLGVPDFVDADGSWSYFFTSPVPKGQMGGGFPELSFAFGAEGLVAHVSCHYSR